MQCTESGGSWNGLQGVKGEVDVIWAFKMLFDRHTDMHGMERYGLLAEISLIWHHVSLRAEH